MRFRKKPIVVDAIQWTGHNRKEIAAFDDFFNDLENDTLHRWDTITIQTLEGIHTASLGDWIIRGVHGELYPCKPDIFKLTYEPAKE